MEKILIVTNKFLKGYKHGMLMGIASNFLYSLRIEKKVSGNQIHYQLEKGIEYCDIKPKESPIDALFARGRIYSDDSRTKDEYSLTELKIKPGIFNPRIFRPLYEENHRGIDIGNSRRIAEIEEKLLGNYNHFPYDIKILIGGLNQLTILTDMLDQILNTIFPSTENLKAYGYNIRNLLVLACIEVEAQLIGIMKSNELAQKTRYTTNDYFKLKHPLHLHEYSTNLSLYPHLNAFSPFNSWDESSPTQSLPWFDHYNAVKHNSELNINKATLESAISAVCALSIILRAQYGASIPFWKEKLGHFYDIQDKIEWSINDYLLPPLEGEQWVSVPYGL